MFHISEAFQRNYAEIRQSRMLMLYSKRERHSIQWFLMGNSRRKMEERNVVYKIPCRDCKLSYIGETSQWYDERESQHRRCIQNQDENNGILRHIRDTGHDIAWENVQFRDFDQRTPCGKMKESFLIDIHASKWKNVESPETKTCAP